MRVHLKHGKASPVITAFLLMLCVVVVVWLFLVRGCSKEASENVEQNETEKPPISGVSSVESIGEVSSSSIEKFEDPATLMSAVKASFQEENLDMLDQLMSKGLTDDERSKLEDFIMRNHDKELSIREVGEVEINKLARWAIKVEGSEEKISLDVRKTVDGSWIVEGVNLDGIKDARGDIFSATGSEGDSLSVADLFIMAILNRNFDKALAFADTASISDAKVASLCIMFEEGDYSLQARKPLRSLFQREGVSAYMANVQAANGEEKGQFGLTLERKNQQEEWKVTEINLDSLLSDYIQRVAGGDAYYTPLVQNPEGGETLALYFDFSEEMLTKRAETQLEIIAGILRTDTSKKLTLSGHADAIGSDEDNNKLSLKRAQNVREFLVGQGISESQIDIRAYGETKPRRKNDSDLGRRANRRTEIYLDF